MSKKYNLFLLVLAGTIVAIIMFLPNCTKTKVSTSSDTTEIIKTDGTNQTLKTVKMAYFDIPHFFVSDGGQTELKGPGVDFVEYVIKEMGYNLEWIGPLSFPRIINDLKIGKIDGCQFLSISPERQEFLLFPDQPFFVSKSFVVLLKDNPLNEIKSLDDIIDLRIGFLTGAQPSTFINDNIDKLNIDYIQIENDGSIANLKKLISGRIDAYHSQIEYAILLELIKLGIEEQVKFVYLPEASEKLYIVFSKSSLIGNELVKEYNKVIESNGISLSDFF